MSTTLLYQAFGIAGYTYRSQHCHEGCIFFKIEQPRHRLRCCQCGSPGPISKKRPLETLLDRVSRV